MKVNIILDLLNNEGKSINKGICMMFSSYPPPFTFGITDFCCSQKFFSNLVVLSYILTDRVWLLFAFSLTFPPTSFSKEPYGIYQIQWLTFVFGLSFETEFRCRGQAGLGLTSLLLLQPSSTGTRGVPHQMPSMTDTCRAPTESAHGEN